MTIPPESTREGAKQIRVILADDHPIVREGLRSLVEAEPGMAVVGEASDGQDAWLRARELEPDVVVLDLSMPVLGGAEATQLILRDCPGVKVLALTMHEERGYVSRLLRLGAAGYLLKRTASSELARAIRAVARGERYVDPFLAGVLLAEQATKPARFTEGEAVAGLDALTAREREVLRLLALGHSNKEIAEELSISVKTVETHRAAGMAKLGLSSRAALVRFGIAEGWLRSGESS